MDFKEFVVGEELVFKAKEFATKKHEGQKRKFNGKPYITHPQAVADLVKKFGGNHEMQAAAFLHDTLEDTDTTEEELRQEFGDVVTDYVMELTNPPISDKSQKGKILVDKMNKMSAGALFIKLVDRLNNVSDFNTAPPSFVEKYKPETEFILDNLKNNFITKVHEEIIEKIKEVIQGVQ